MILKLSTGVNVGTLLSRDVMWINPIINGTAGGPDPAAIAEEWATAFAAWLTPIGTPRITVKVYDVQKHPHGPALATVTKNSLTALLVNAPRELAVCLSFFSGANVKRRRGRLYVPLSWVEGTTQTGPRPSNGVQTKVMALAQLLQDLGGLGEDWSVYSKVDDTARAVSDFWVDNEWDIQRRRGDRPTSRLTGTTSE